MTRKRGVLLLAALVFAGGAGAIWWQAAQPERATSSCPRCNLIVVTIDTLRADHLPMYGYHRETAPNMARFAGEGTLFENAFSNSPSTKSAVASLFTSLYPSQHKAIRNEDLLPDEVVTLAEILNDSGYATLAVNANGMIKRPFNYHQGFDAWVDTDKSTADKVNRSVRKLLKKNSAAPFFLYVHYLDPHSPYTAPEPFQRRFNPDYDGVETGRLKKQSHGGIEGTAEFYRRRPERFRQLVHFYDNEIAYVDHKLGELFAWLKQEGLYEDSVILLLADHGEMFLEHDLLMHSCGLYGELIRVPMILKVPGDPGGRRLSANVQTIDLLPTLTSILDVEPGEPRMGRSVLSSANWEERGILSEHLRLGNPNPQRSFIVGGHKLILDLAGEDHALYDMRQDPSESNNLLPGSAESRAKWRQLRKQMLERLEVSARLAAHLRRETTELDAETIEELKALGYL